MVDQMKEDHINVNNNNFNFDKNILNNQLQRKKNFRQDSLFPRLRLFQVVDELLVRAVRSTFLLESLNGFVFTTNSEIISLVKENKLKQKKKMFVIKVIKMLKI